MIECYDLLVGNKARTKVLPLTTAYIAHLRNQFDHVFTVLIFLPRFKTIYFYRKTRKIKSYCCKKITKSSDAEGFVPRVPMASDGWGYHPHNSHTEPSHF